jgi:hypothetical protein
MSEEKVFADGFLFKRNENAPEFVVGQMSIKVDEAITFIRQHAKNGWVNLEVKQARSGSYYMELNKFEPKTKDEPTESKQSKPSASKAQKKEEEEELPF